MVNFIYCPKSGSRVFAREAKTAYVAIVTCRNGCRHVCGGHKLTYHTATPGQYWRGQAKRMASLLVNRFGGIGWDEQGQVSLIVPLQNALECHRLMTAAGRSANVRPGYGAGLAEDENSVGLLLAGYEPAAGADSLEPSWLPEDCHSMACIGVEVADTTRWRDATDDERNSAPCGVNDPVVEVTVRMLTHEGQRLNVVQTAPLSWGCPTISPPALLREAVNLSAMEG